MTFPKIISRVFSPVIAFIATLLGKDHNSGNEPKYSTDTASQKELARSSVIDRCAEGKLLGEVVMSDLGDSSPLEERFKKYKSYNRYFSGFPDELLPFVYDSAVTDILINPDGKVWVDSAKGLFSAPVTLDTKAVKQLAIRLSSMCGNRLDQSCPIMDGTLPTGIRVNAIIDPVADGVAISLRLKSVSSYKMQDLYDCNTIPVALSEIFDTLIKGKHSILISGATGTGKTTLLSAFSNSFSYGERVVFIEEVPEITSTNANSVFLHSRQKNIEGKGEISLSALVHSAMRMRPDRIVLGECRGRELADILNAFNTGHEGGLCTIHANDISNLPARLLALGYLANMSQDSIYIQSFSAFSVVLHLSRKVVDNKVHRWISQIGVFDLQDSKLVCIKCIEIDEHSKITISPQAHKLFEKLNISSRTVDNLRA